MFLFTFLAENWGFYTLLTELPTFMADILNYNVDKVFLSAINLVSQIFINIQIS